jgi:hypothetical protein
MRFRGLNGLVACLQTVMMMMGRFDHLTTLLLAVRVSEDAARLCCLLAFVLGELRG